MPDGWLGLDIGGANLKAAMCDGFARQTSFPLWRRPSDLPAAIANLVNDAPPHAGLAVTMTAELADCYASKAQGVTAVVAAMEQAAQATPTAYYAISAAGQFLDATRATAAWPRIAASNWHALTSACARLGGASGLLVDVGSTTTDVIPFANGCPQTDALHDTARLLSGQLLYQGVGRTPLCAVVNSLPYRGRSCPVAAELFATTADVALLLGFAQPSQGAATADGRPLTRPHTIARLARMLCADTSQFDEEDAMTAAHFVHDRLEDQLATTVKRAIAAMDTPNRVVVAGAGAWLALSALGRIGYSGRVTSLADEIGHPASVCAPAWAVAWLKDEEHQA